MTKGSIQAALAAVSTARLRVDALGDAGGESARLLARAWADLTGDTGDPFVWASRHNGFYLSRRGQWRPRGRYHSFTNPCRGIPDSHATVMRLSQASKMRAPCAFCGSRGVLAKLAVEDAGEKPLRLVG